jgi:hypothetical protein
MKIRNGFVSNSSSSSFIIALYKTDKTYLYETLLSLGEVYDNAGVTEITPEEAIERVHDDLSEYIFDPVKFAEKVEKIDALKEAKYTFLLVGFDHNCHPFNYIGNINIDKIILWESH